MSNPAVVVAGLPVLARALGQSGLFPKVLEAGDVNGLKQLAVGQELRGLRPSDVLFMLSDTLVSTDPAFPLAEFVRRVTGAGYRVLIVAQTPIGIDLQRDFPQAGLLTVPLRLNDVMFALSNFGFAVGPQPGGGEPIDLSGTASSTLSSPPSGWGSVTPAASTPQAGGWQQPTESPFQGTPSTPQPAATTPRPAAASTQIPAGPGWAPPADNRPRTLADFTPRPAVAPSTAPSAAWDTPQAAGSGSWGSTPEFNAPAVRFGSSAPAAPATRRRGMVITVAVSKGGTGKSTLSLNLAAYLGSRFKNANPGRSVCIIDTNYQQADTGKYMGQFTPNIVNLIKDPSLMTPERIVNALVHRTDMNFSALLGPATPDDALALLTADTGQNGSSFSARFYNEVLDLLKQHYDYIFIDTPVAEKFHSLFREFALPVADYIIVPVIPSKQTVHNTYMWLNSAVIAPKVARGAGIRPEQIGIVLNRAEDGVGYGELEVMEELRMFNYLGAIPETTEWKRANNEGELIAARNKSDINEAFARILGQVTGEPSLLSGAPIIEHEAGGLSARFRALFKGRNA